VHVKLQGTMVALVFGLTYFTPLSALAAPTSQHDAPVTFVPSGASAMADSHRGMPDGVPGGSPEQQGVVAQPTVAGIAQDSTTAAGPRSQAAPSHSTMAEPVTGNPHH
jgi:hypothetical protein